MKNYVSPTIELIELTFEDILTTSPNIDKPFIGEIDPL